MTVPRVAVATYRIQFNRSFRFDDARRLVPYLRELGISDLYASPLLQARRGSTHGYDVTDPTRLNPELGTAEEFESLVRELERHGMGLLLDIVPNHMAASPENPWWRDVLENGPSSQYASYFDIDWHPAGGGALENKVLLPVLGRPYNQALLEQEFALAFDQHGFFVRYHDLRLPLDPKSCCALLAYRLETLRDVLGGDSSAFRRFARSIDSIRRLPDRTTTDPARKGERRRNRETIKRKLWRLYNTHPEVREFLDENIRVFNGTKEDAGSFGLLDRLLADQPYHLAFWREAMARINYRRFFDISDLVCLRLEDPEVFAATHALILGLAKERKISGLRIDHVDGLYDPLGYLRQLRSRVPSGDEGRKRKGSAFYVVVEKILASDESLPGEWPAAGTTSYDFLNAVNALFIDPEGLKALDGIYARFTGAEGSFADVRYARKKQVMEELFAGEVATLGRELGRLAAQAQDARGLVSTELVEALVEVTACLPVYRIYVRGFEVGAQDRMYIERAIAEARRRYRSSAALLFEFLRRVFLLDLPRELSPDERHEWLRFVMRWQQFTGPVMAKGVEDTALYVYNRLLSLNEVGGDPEGAGVPHAVEAFHRLNQARLACWPHTLNATSTHDTKRGEDVRARIDVLSELPEEWARCLSRWSRWNRKKKRPVDGRLVPDANEELLLYQTLIGAWPLDDEDTPAFKERVKAYVVKAAREAKDHTSWIQPDASYERALAEFVDSILDAFAESRFPTDFLRFQEKVAYHGAMNSLAQVLLKLTSPGVPDFYQGTELWDLSLVDPDNRRPVDFAKRMDLLEVLRRRETDEGVPLAQELLSHWRDGRVKLYVMAIALGFRRAHAGLFLKGDYLPLFCSGPRKEHVVAWARRRGKVWAIVAVPRFLARLSARKRSPAGRRIWLGTALSLPEGAPMHWSHVLTGEAIEAVPDARGKLIRVGDVFSRFPVALLSGTSR